MTATARLGDEVLAVDTFNITREAARTKFAEQVCDGQSGIDVADVQAELRRLAADIVKVPKPKPGGGADAPDDPLAETPSEVKGVALAMLRAPDLIQQIVDDVATLGVAGEKKLAATLYLVGTSRLLVKPLASIVQGLTSSGKSFTIDIVALLFPPESVIRAHKMTPEALVHMPDGALVHMFVVGGERSRKQDDESADATRALREMLSDGRLTKLIAMKRGQGIETVQIDQPGPIAYVESTTLQDILDEDRNRCLVLATDETPAQTQRIIQQLAQRKVSPASNTETSNIVEKHRAAQRMLFQCHVVIPYARRLGDQFPYERTDARRAFGHVLAMIEAVTLLHQYQRTADPADGAVIVATPDDYILARRLLAGPFAQSMGDGLSDAARRFGERLRERFQGVEFDTNDAARLEKIIGDIQTIRQYVRALATAGRLEQTEPHKGSKPAKYKLNTRTPDDATVAGLPDRSVVFDGDGSSPRHRVDSQTLEASGVTTR